MSIFKTTMKNKNKLAAHTQDSSVQSSRDFVGYVEMSTAGFVLECV